MSYKKASESAAKRILERFIVAESLKNIEQPCTHAEYKDMVFIIAEIIHEEVVLMSNQMVSVCPVCGCVRIKEGGSSDGKHWHEPSHGLACTKCMKLSNAEQIAKAIVRHLNIARRLLTQNKKPPEHSEGANSDIDI